MQAFFSSENVDKKKPFLMALQAPNDNALTESGGVGMSNNDSGAGNQMSG